MTQLEALTLTLALELPVVLGVAKWLHVDLWRALIAGVAASGITHPLAWAMAMQMSPGAYRWGWYAIELTVCGVEAVILGLTMRLRPRQAGVLSVVANALSALMGRFVL